MSSFFLIIFIKFILLYHVRSFQQIRADNNSLSLPSILDQDTILSDNYANCFLVDYDNMILYDFTKMKFLNDSEMHTKEDDEDFTIKTNEMNFYFNFCKNTKFKCNHTDSLITVQYKDDTCMSFTKSSNILKDWIYYGTNSPVLNLKMESDVKCSAYRNYSVYYKFICDSSMKEGEFRLANENYEDEMNYEFRKDNSGYSFEDLCTKKITFVSKQACPSVFTVPLSNFYIKYVYIFGMLQILLGFVVLFYGYNQESFTTYIFSVSIIFYLIFTIFTMHTKYVRNLDDSLLWILTFLQVIMGLCMGYFLNNTEKLKRIVFGGLTGFAIFSNLYYIFLGKLHFFTLLCYYLFILIFCFSYSLAYLFMEKRHFAIIFSSSVCGAFLIIKVKLFSFF